MLVAAWFVGASLARRVVSIPLPQEVGIEIIKALTSPVGPYTLIGHLWWSLRRVLVAFALAVALGLPLGLMMGWSKVFEAVSKPVFELLRPIPPIAWIPLAILWFGIGETPKVFICFIGAFVSVTVNTYAGVKLVDPVLVGAARTLGANERQLFFEVVIPASMPAIWAGLQTGLSSSWMCLLAAEMVRSTEGVGWMIIMGMESVNTRQILVAMVAIGTVGALLSTAMRLAERKVCPWVAR